MASVNKRVRNGQVTWLARYRAPDGRQRKRSFTKKSDAERFQTQMEHAQLTGRYVDPAAGRVTVAVWAERWLAAHGHLKPSTYARYEGIVSRHLIPTWGPVLSPI